MRFDEYVLMIGFQRCSYNPCVYCKDQDNDDAIYILLYVYDMLVVSKKRDKLKQLKKLLNAEFEMKDMGIASRILRMERSKRKLYMIHSSYVTKI